MPEGEEFLLNASHRKGCIYLPATRELGAPLEASREVYGRDPRGKAA